MVRLHAKTAQEARGLEGKELPLENVQQAFIRVTGIWPGMCRCDVNVVETDLLGLTGVQALLQTLMSSPVAV